MNNILHRVPLAPMTTLGIGGPAVYFAKASTVPELIEALEFADSSNLDVFVLGGGSNLLVSDQGIDALVLKVAIGGVEFHEQGNTTEVTAGAGVDWDRLVAMCVERDLAGLECLSGIPGLVGGTPIQNVGAYGQEVSESIVSVTCFDLLSREMVEMSNAQCRFEYRSSVFNGVDAGRYTVLGVKYSLLHKGRPKVVYKDLVEHFRGEVPTVAEVREAVLRIRRSKSMVIHPADPNSRSAGSFFKNPIVSNEDRNHLRGMFGNIPSFEFEGKVKIPAAWLIENAGFKKGSAYGNVGISANHTLAIVNLGGGTAEEVLDLMKLIQNAVHSKFGISLTPEPIFIGFRPGALSGLPD